jgi:hypothetical protein
MVPTARIARGWLCAAAALLVLALAGGNPLAETENEDWAPDPPMPDEWDWIQLNSGEWLKGEIKVVYDETMEFESDELDNLSLDLDDIRQIRSGRPMQVRFTDDAVLFGKLLVQGDSVRVLDGESKAYTRDEVMTIIAGRPKEWNYWSGKISLGFSLRRGNSDVFEVNSKVNIKRQTVENRISFDYIANYNVTNSEEVANNQRVTVGWDKFINRRLYVSPVFFEYFRDPFQNIADRYTIGAGVGYELIDSKKVTWTAAAGPAYMNTSFVSVEPGASDSVDTPTLVAGTFYDHELTGWMDFNFEYRFQWVNEESGTYNHHMVVGFETEVTSLLDFDITFVWDRIQDPQPAEDGTIPQQDDVRTIVGLGIEF